MSGARRQTLVLSLFPGIGLFDIAWEELGVCIVRGPDQLWGGDIHRFHPPSGMWDGIVGGPPCQAFSRLRHMVEANGYQTAPNLIPEFERVVREALPLWFVMENVPDAPEPCVAGYGVSSLVLNNRWFGGEQNRVRRFSFGVQGEPVNLWRYVEMEALEPAGWQSTVTTNARVMPVKIGGSGKHKRMDLNRGPRRTVGSMCELQGLPAAFLDSTPLSESGKRRVVGNGVPLPLGRAIAKAVLEATEVPV